MTSRLRVGDTVRLRGGDVDLKVYQVGEHAVWLYNPKTPHDVRSFDFAQVVVQ